MKEARFTTTGCATSTAAGSMAARLTHGRSLAGVARMEQADVFESLGGLPPDSEHGALLASNTRKAAVRSHPVRGTRHASGGGARRGGW